MALESLLAGNTQIANADEINAGDQLCVPSNCSLAAPTPTPGVLLQSVPPLSEQSSDSTHVLRQCPYACKFVDERQRCLMNSHGKVGHPCSCCTANELFCM